jgi:DNA-binding CsgD family transcriptional regulator
MPTTLRGAESTFDAIERLADSGLPAQELIEEVGPRIDRVVPSDGYFIAATDPHTTLCLGAGVAHELPEEGCQPTWDYEFQVPDYAKWTDMVRDGRAVVDLHEETGGRPERSPRFREFSALTGLRAELRAAFAAGGAAFGIAQLNRSGDAPRYSDDERAWLERVAPVVARGLRRALLLQPSESPRFRGPGIVVLDGVGHVVSATREAEAWFDDVDSAVPPVSRRRESDFPLPFEAQVYASRVRAAAEIDAAPPCALPRTRLRTRSGVWLLLHASPLIGEGDHLAIVVEPAKASDVAPLIVEAYGLTQRELEVTRAISRGLGTAEIAAELFLSPHTVRDHVKSVFEKVGVSSRAELVAKVFAEHYSPPTLHV